MERGWKKKKGTVFRILLVSIFFPLFHSKDYLSFQKLALKTWKLPNLSNLEQWQRSVTKIMSELKIEPLFERRKKSRLLLLCKGLHQQAAIPTDQLQCPKRKTRNMHQEHFINISTRTDTLKASFLPNTVRDWNHLPSVIINKIKAAKSPVESFAAILKNGLGQC